MVPITFALFGAGRIGRIHAANIARSDLLRLKYVCDPHAESAATIATLTGGEVVGEATIFADPMVDAVLIASSADSHPDLIRRAATSGKAVFCEKPIARLATEVISCLDIVEKTGCRLFLAFNRRFDPSFSALKQRLVAGEVGRPELIILTSRDPSPPPISYVASSGGLFRETMVHDFDVARWLLGEEPIELYATASCLVDPAIGQSGSPDTAVVTLKTRSGAICTINNSWRASYGYDQRVEVLGSNGALFVDNLRPTSVRVIDAASARADLPLPFFLERYADAYRIELETFVRQLRAAMPASPNGFDGLRALQLADCAARSVAENRPIEVA